jgi:predicted MFS family arabinose efflux permease
VPAYCFAAILSAIAVILLAGIVEPPRARTAAQHSLRDLREGVVFVARHQLLRPILATQFVFNIALFIIMAIYAPYAIHRLHLSAATVGLTLAAFGVGMVAGALAAPRIMRRLALGTVIAIGPVSGFIAALLMTLTVVVPSGWLAGLSFFLMGAGPIVWVISTTTLRQTVTPGHLLGRVSSINALAYGARPIGAGIGALVGGFWGPELCLVVAAVGFFAQVVIVLLSPVVSLERRSPGQAAMPPVTTNFVQFRAR